MGITPPIALADLVVRALHEPARPARAEARRASADSFSPGPCLPRRAGMCAPDEQPAEEISIKWTSRTSFLTLVHPFAMRDVEVVVQLPNSWVSELAMMCLHHDRSCTSLASCIAWVLHATLVPSMTSKNICVSLHHWITRRHAQHQLCIPLDNKGSMHHILLQSLAVQPFWGMCQRQNTDANFKHFLVVSGVQPGEGHVSIVRFVVAKLNEALSVLYSPPKTVHVL